MSGPADGSACLNGEQFKACMDSGSSHLNILLLTCSVTSFNKEPYLAIKKCSPGLSKNVYWSPLCSACCQFSLAIQCIDLSLSFFLRLSLIHSLLWFSLQLASLSAVCSSEVWPPPPPSIVFCSSLLFPRHFAMRRSLSVLFCSTVEERIGRGLQSAGCLTERACHKLTGAWNTTKRRLSASASDSITVNHSERRPCLSLQSPSFHVVKFQIF